MRRQRFRWEWARNSLIFRAVNLGILAGFLLSFVAPMWAAYVASALVATVALLRWWFRAEASRPPGLLADEPIAQATEEARAFDPHRSSPWRIPLAALAMLAMILGIGLSTLLPDWMQLLLQIDIVVFFLTLIVTLVEAYGPLGSVVALVVPCVHQNPRQILGNLGGLSLPRPVILGNGQLLLGPFNLEAEHELAALTAIEGRLRELAPQRILWPAFPPSWGRPAG